MRAIEVLLARLIDYAGLYPPAALDMASAVRNYTACRSEPWGPALGRFVVSAERMCEFRQAAADTWCDIPLTVIASKSDDLASIWRLKEEGFAIESLEMKCNEPLTIMRIAEAAPSNLEMYFEIPPHAVCTSVLDAIASSGTRAKLRMGGVTHNAFPCANTVVEMLSMMQDRNVPFKATAGLHHPIRSEHRLSYAPDSESARMHGFLNLFCASAIIREQRDRTAAQQVLEEEDSTSFTVNTEAIQWRSHTWNVDEILQTRQQFFTSFGSCSLSEPIQDLEALGWL